MVNPAYWENGFRNLTNSKRPVTKAEEFDGIKLRVMQNNMFLDRTNTTRWPCAMNTGVAKRTSLPVAGSVARTQKALPSSPSVKRMCRFRNLSPNLSPCET